MVLSAQSILDRKYMLQPFVDVKTVHLLTGTSYGLSAAGYDVRLRQSINLGPGEFSLGSTLEYFRMPRDIIAFVHDKSTFARMGLAVQNTVIEPGWAGFLTVELTNHNTLPIHLIEGQPIAQIIFHFLDQPTMFPYNGKYQNQEDAPIGARQEN